MRLTFLHEPVTQAAMLVAWVASAGCQRLPYIDQSKSVPMNRWVRLLKRIRRSRRPIP